MGQIKINWENLNGRNSRAVASGYKVFNLKQLRNELVETAFRSIGPKNPLRQLQPDDRATLWSSLKLYDRILSSGSSEMSSQLEAADRAAAQAGKLAAQLERDVFGSPAWDLLGPFLHKFASLPKYLRDFSVQADQLLSSLGKPGRKEGVLQNSLLVYASEFVRLKTGKHNDEHLAELFQGVVKRKLSEDFTGDAIRKKRARFMEEYPVFYQDILVRVETDSAL